MRIVILRQPLQRFLRWTQRLLLAAAVAMLAWCGFVLIDSWSFQRNQRLQFDLRLAARPPAAVEILKFATPAVLISAPAAGALIGRISIPRLGLSVMVMQGTGRATLRRAVGHIAGTGFPGRPGNVGISGHRDTFFRPLRNIRPDDVITLTTPLGEYSYRVVSTKVVAPGDVAVLDPGSLEILTLVTCYPFYFVGPAPGRYIVRAERVANIS